MATRIWQGGAEVAGRFSHLFEFDASYGDFEASSTHPYTSNHGYMYESTDDGGFVSLSTGRRKLRVANWYRHQTASITRRKILVLHNADINGGGICDVSIKQNKIKIGVNDLVVAESPDVFLVNTYYHIGVDINVDSSGGWISVFVDGNLVVSFSGNTGNEDVYNVQFGSYDYNRTGSFDDTVYVDDLFIAHHSDGTYIAPPIRRFGYIVPNQDGWYSDCISQDDDSTYNYENVDDVPYDGDNSYNASGVVGQKDTYSMADFTLGVSGYSIRVLIPTFIARKLEDSVDAKVSAIIRLGGVDSVAATYHSLSTQYKLYWERKAQTPSDNSWNQTYVDNVEVGFVSGGDF